MSNLVRFAVATRHLDIAPYSLLKPLPVPERLWDSISMDFIEHLPDSNGFTAILVVIDRTSKQAIFIPTHDTINSKELARLFVIHVFSKHGIPNHITSDRGSEFVSQFTRALAKALDMELHFTSLPDTIRRPTDKRNMQIKPWNSTSASIVLINRTTGIYYYLLLNLHTTMRRTPPPESLHSSPTKATILISLFIRNVISPPLGPATL